MSSGQATTTAAGEQRALDYERLYEYRFRDIPQSLRSDTWQEIAAFVEEALGRPRRLLDPAAGRREFVDAATAPERWAVDEVDHAGAPPPPGVRVLVSDIFDAELPGEHFDGIFVSNFLEHLPSQDAVAAFLGRMLACTAPGGRIAIMGPNFKYCAREYFDCADHVVALSHIAVSEHLYAAGYEPVRIVPRFLPYSFRGRLPVTRSLVRRYLQTPLAWRLLGKQFLVIGQRPVTGGPALTTAS